MLLPSKGNSDFWNSLKSVLNLINKAVQCLEILTTKIVPDKLNVHNLEAILIFCVLSNDSVEHLKSLIETMYSFFKNGTAHSLTDKVDTLFLGKELAESLKEMKFWATRVNGRISAAEKERNKLNPGDMATLKAIATILPGIADQLTIDAKNAQKILDSIL